MSADPGTGPDRQPGAPFLGGRGAPIVITGGSGFIGSNLADSYLREGEDVVVLDNLSRPGVEQNLGWLQDNHGPRLHPLRADVSRFEDIRDVLAEAKAVFHLAAQTAVTTSLTDPFDDFEINARGSLNVLEAVRRSGRRVPVIFASTNKVYGALEDLRMIECADRYTPEAPEIRDHGIGENRPLAFCTPYGCSKGVADQYVLDYAATFDLPTVVLRMSCIYGPRQFGTEDQGWVAHFLIRALENQSISIFGDGRQVRDILHVADAVAAYRLALRHADTVRSRVFNLGGGPSNAVSLRAVLREIEMRTGRALRVDWSDWRPGDQLFYVSDTRRIEAELGWRAEIGWREGLRDLAAWLLESRACTAAGEQVSA